MSLLQSLLHLTNFKSPLLRTLIPAVSAAYAIQAAFAVPSIIAQNERFYDFSGSLTYLSVTALSLYLPSLRAKYSSAVASSAPLPGLLEAFTKPGGVGALNWRQVVISGAVAFWAVRRNTPLPLAARGVQKPTDCVPQSDRTSSSASWKKAKILGSTRSKSHRPSLPVPGSPKRLGSPSASCPSSL